MTNFVKIFLWKKNIPIGGRARKVKRTRIDQPSVSQVVSVVEQVNNHQPFSHAQETNEILGTFGGSSSSAAAVGNHFSYSTETHSVMAPPIRSIPPMARFDGSFNQGYYGDGFNDLVGNPLMNQSFGGNVGNYNSYFVNQEDPNKRNQSFNNSMNMNHSASTSGSREYPGIIDYMINNNNKNFTFRLGQGRRVKDVPIGGRARKIKHIDQPSVSQVVPDEIQQVNHHQPFSHVQETTQFLEPFGGSSSSAVVGNHFSSLPETHGDMMLPTRSIPPMDLFDGLFHQGYYGAGLNNFVGNHLMNQSIGGHVDNYNSYRVNQENPNMRNQSFTNTMIMNHNAGTSERRGYPGIDHMINKNNNNNKSVERIEKEGAKGGHKAALTSSSSNNNDSLVENVEAESLETQPTQEVEEDFKVESPVTKGENEEDVKGNQPMQDIDEAPKMESLLAKEGEIKEEENEENKGEQPDSST
ncbi:unnamed protein product [Brassica rapa subsp. trilocularis]